MDRKVLNILSGLAGQVRQFGLIFALRAAAWRLRVFLEKGWIGFQDRHNLYPYSSWIHQFEIQGPPGSAIQLASSPRFTILVYTPRSSDADLQRTIQSIAGQNYFYWEARLVCEGTGDCGPAEWPLGSDFRFLPFSVEECVNWADALQVSRGAYVMAIPAGAALAPHALQEMTLRLGSDPALDIVYYDEDRLSEDGKKRHSPFFKPDWSPELFLSVNYLLNAAIRRSLLLEAMAGLDTGYAGYLDLVYQVVGRTTRIAHIARVLLHHPVRSSLEETSLEQQVARVQRFLAARNLPDVAVSATPAGAIRATWKLPARLVSIIIPTRDQVDYLRRCLDSLDEFTGELPFEIILVDSGSREPATLEYYAILRQRGNLQIVAYPGEFNFSAALNLGARHANGDLFLFLNNDTRAVQPGWLEELARWALLPGVGMAGGLLLYPDGSIQHAGIVMGMEGHASHVYAGSPETVSGLFVSPLSYRNVSAVTGACMMMRRDVFDELGGFDQTYRLVFSDVEICLRAGACGYRVVYTPFARLVHYEGRTRHRSMPFADLQLGYDHFLAVIRQGDPYYNPNLSLAVRTPTLRRGWEPGPGERLERILRYYSDEGQK